MLLKCSLCLGTGVVNVRGRKEDVASSAKAVYEAGRIDGVRIQHEQHAKIRADALEEAANHFRPQIRTYTGKQIAMALLELRDGKIIRALKSPKAKP